MLPHPPTVSFINKLRSVHFTVCMLYLNTAVCVTCTFISQVQTSSWQYTAVTEISFRELPKVTNSWFNSVMGNSILRNSVRSE